MIKQGVSLYSYQEQFYLRKMNLEQCIAAAAKAGATGIELIPEQMCWQEYLDPSDAFAARFAEWMQQYQVEPVAIDVFFDYVLFPNRVLTHKEQIKMYENNIQFAKKLGFPIVRAMMSTKLELLREMWEVAADYGVKFGIEVHAPMTITSPYFLKLMDMMEKTGTKSGGLIPDISIFSKRPPQVQLDQMIRNGASAAMADRIVEMYVARVPLKEAANTLTLAGATARDLEMLRNAYASIASNPDDILLAKGKIIHVHGKVYDMNENCEEEALDYETAIDRLKKIDYDGFISTEYEGQRSFHDLAAGDMAADEIEQVRRHQVLLRRLIAG